MSCFPVVKKSMIVTAIAGLGQKHKVTDIMWLSLNSRPFVIACWMDNRGVRPGGLHCIMP